MTPDVCTYVSWEIYRKMLRACEVLKRKEGKNITVYMFAKRAILKALKEGLEKSLDNHSIDDPKSE